jgi:hypothetical protein
VRPLPREAKGQPLRARGPPSGPQEAGLTPGPEPTPTPHPSPGGQDAPSPG